jgi:hypothetical protein
MDFDSVHPDAPALQKRVQERTGLVDFGVPPLEVPLSVLMRSLAEEANLHRLGRFLASVHIRDLLETRLRLVEFVEVLGWLGSGAGAAADFRNWHATQRFHLFARTPLP